MNLPNVIVQLKARDKLLTVIDLTTLFGVHRHTIRQWRKTRNFPEAVTIEKTCFFRPDQVLAWAIAHRDAERDLLDIDEILERVGVLYKTWVQWVKKGQAPAPCERELGTGRHLWNEKEIEQWLQKMTGGFARPRIASAAKTITPRASVRRGPKHHEKTRAAAQ